MALLKIGRFGYSSVAPASGLPLSLSAQEQGQDTASFGLTNGIVLELRLVAQEIGQDTFSAEISLNNVLSLSAQETGQDTASFTLGNLANDPTLTDIVFNDNNNGSAPSLQVQGGYVGSDQINALLEFYEGATLRATVTVLNLTVVSNNYDFTETIEASDLVYESGSNASNIPNVDSIEVTVSEATNGGSVGPVPEPVSGLSVTPPVITWATNTTGTQFIGTGDKNLFFAQDLADWSFGGVAAGAPTVTAVTGSGTNTITITVSGNLPVDTDTPTISYTNTDTDLRGPDSEDVADFVAASVTNNVLPAGGATVITTSSPVAYANGEAMDDPAGALFVEIASRQVSGGQLVADTTNALWEMNGGATREAYYYVDEDKGADQILTVVLEYNSAGTAIRPRFRLGATTASPDTAGHEISLWGSGDYQIDLGSTTNISGAGESITQGADTTVQFTTDSTAQTIEMRVNGTLVNTFTGQSGLGGGYMGVGVRVAGGLAADSVQIKSVTVDSV